MGIIKSFKNSDWYKDRYGENAGVERLVELLKKNNGHYIFSYSRHDRQLIEVRGTGNLLRGKGRNREYDIETRRFEIGHRQGKPVTDWVPLNKVNSSDLWGDLTANDYGYINGLAIEATFNEVDDVMDNIRAIVVRLKPHQSYTFGNLKLTHQMYASADSINCTVKDDAVYPVPVSLLKSKYLVSPEIIGKSFNKDMVGVASEAKINRHHRSIHDLKRWYTCKQVPSSMDRHNIRFTHRRSAGADVRYYQLDFLLDSTLIIGYPFYASQLFQRAIRDLEKTYPDSDWLLELDIAETIIHTHTDEKLALLVYSNRQASSRGHVDKFPVLIQDTPVVRNYVTYGGKPGWDIMAAKKNEQED